MSQEEEAKLEDARKDTKKRRGTLTVSKVGAKVSKAPAPSNAKPVKNSSRVVVIKKYRSDEASRQDPSSADDDASDSFSLSSFSKSSAGIKNLDQVSADAMRNRKRAASSSARRPGDAGSDSSSAGSSGKSSSPAAANTSEAASTKDGTDKDPALDRSVSQTRPTSGDDTKQKKTTYKDDSKFEEGADAKKAKKAVGSEVRRERKKISIATVMAISGDEDADELISRKYKKRGRRRVTEVKDISKTIRDVMLPEVITVSDLANRMAEKVGDVIKALLNLGVMATANQTIDSDTAELIVSSMGHRFKKVTPEELERDQLPDLSDPVDSLHSRPPIVTVMGHVDHGKTSLLDTLRGSDVAANELEGITQRIGAYSVSLPNGGFITFFDTPGHEDFTAMRSCGAKVTDIVVLVVAADDGVMAQTIEAINHAKAASVPIIVAINKMDKEGADPTRVKNDLLRYGVVAEDMGGDAMVVEISAKTGLNIDKLLDTISLQAELMELKASDEAVVNGIVVEAELNKQRGIVATLLIHSGTLRVSDMLVAGPVCGRVRLLLDEHGKAIASATASMPVQVLGLESVPRSGEQFFRVESEKQARDLVEIRLEIQRLKSITTSAKSFEELFNKTGDLGKTLGVIVKSDTHGSGEAASMALGKLDNEEVKVHIVHSGVGEISESDVLLADTSSSVLVGFNVRANKHALVSAKRLGIKVVYHSVIYHMVDEINAIVSGMVAPVLNESVTASAEVRKIFNLSNHGKVAGCYVLDGTVMRSNKVRIIRDGIVIQTAEIKALKRMKDDVKEVNSGFEFGISFVSFDDIREGDMLEFFEIKVGNG